MGRSRILLGVVVAAVLLATTACVPLGTEASGGYRKSCDLGFMPVKPTVTGPSILGNGWAKCDAPPERHELTLSLERRERGTGWIEIASISSSAIPSPRTTYEVKTTCHAGTWRVSATARGSVQGNPFLFTDHSIERFVTAQDCARGR